ncbi:amidohydrolase family protein [Paenibacillus sacheonensis]|uniref:Amidohydrolase family protein n=1 Tax=Paenibacillus sacheonensis TaxID=742054 RepID=A0A7X4YSZ3_9BACL|nr:amidohydrolase family protein [Paenibacillus sacheonensis]MBM7567777.1 cytosine/adenosine deaminase-related metal-dependent hydrolase [Paenibacillus sacheonensis]NBC71953.1 amidohydrolase family protein [Paenibacillus sacheonensis]
MNHSAYWLINVRLESGYGYEQGRIVETHAEICHIRVEDGKIAAISDSGSRPNDGLPQYDAAGLLMLPAFKEMHIHIDKTYYGGPWRAVRPIASIFERFAEERELLPQLLPTARERAENMLGMLVGYGSTHVRTHCNIDPVVGLHNLEAAMRALETFSGKLTHEVVAFPQHGLLRSDAIGLVRDAMSHGATHVGGVDPASVDENIEKSLQTIMDIAVQANAGVDIHIHDRGELGLATMHRLADLTEQAGWQNRVTVSHAFGFAGAVEAAAAELAERFAGLGISVASTVPIGTMIMPIPMLREKGVNVELGNDSITDHWSPFGIGDCLEKAGRLAELYRYADERSLAEALGFITGGVLPLDANGKRVWPAVGDKADAVLVQASCSSEAVARRAKREAVLFGGAVVAGSLAGAPAR